MLTVTTKVLWRQGRCRGHYRRYSPAPPYGPVNWSLYSNIRLLCSGLLTARLADIISTVEFDHTGNYLATGDKGGRVVLFERNETVSRISSGPHGPLPSAIAEVPFADVWLEKNLRIQVPHRVPVTRTRIRLPQVARDRGKDQQDQVVSATERFTLPPLHQRQDNKAMEGVRKIVKGGGGEQSLT